MKIETPTPRLRWKESHGSGTMHQEGDGIETRVLQQLWDIKENGEHRLEWRDVPDVPQDAPNDRL